MSAGLRIGIIGLGGAGRAHARRFSANDDVEKVIGYDVRDDAQAGIDTLGDLDEFMENVDAVSICSPDDTHFEFIERCLLSDKHVLVEKPMVTNGIDAISIRGILEDCPHLRFAVHHQMRYVPAFQKAKTLMEEGALGETFYIEANYWHDMRERSTRYDDWRVRGKGQSVIFGAACHPLDLILYLISDDVESSSTFSSHNGFREYPSYTSVTCMLKFIGGVVAKCHANLSAVFPQYNNLVILGDTATYSDGIIYRNGGFENVSRPGGTEGRAKWRSRKEFSRNKLLSLLMRDPLFRMNPFSVYNHEIACRTITDNFVNAILFGEEILVGYEDGLRVVRLCERIAEQVLGND